MSRSIGIDSSAEVKMASSKSRFSFKKPSWKQIKRAGVKTTKFLWRWLKWPLILGLVAAVIVAGYYIVPPIAGAIWFLLKSLLQLVWAVIAIAFTSLWTSISHLFGVGDGTLSVSYDAWLFANEDLDSYFDDFFWGTWTLEGIAVYVIGGLTGLLLSYAIGRPIYRSQVKKARARREQKAVELREAQETHDSALRAEFNKGKKAGVQGERQTVRRALIHAYKPKMELPPVPEKHTRVFWVNLHASPDWTWASNDRAIHWCDIEGGAPERAIGAPAYKRVTSDEADALAMMGVVYTLNGQASDW